MRIEVRVVLAGRAVATDTAVCRVEIRDVSLLDAPSVTVSSARLPVSTVGGPPWSVTLEAPEDAFDGRDLTVWAHLSMAGSEGIQPGDYLTVRAYPIMLSTCRITVELQPVR